MIKLLNLVLLLLVKSCADGKSLRRVSHGKTAATHQFPYFAQLRKTLPINESFYRYAWCSATLINPQWILTAAHCFPNSNETLSYLIKKKLIAVLMDTNVKGGANAQTKLVVQVQIHERYLMVYAEGDQAHEYVDHIENDIAIAKVASPYRLSQSIKVITLPHGDGAPICKKGTVIGIGRETLGPHIGITYAQMAVTPINQLNDIVPPSNTTFYSKGNWTAGHTLEGDSGGPFVCRFGRISVQYGITSNGYPSSDSEGYITEFTAVVKYEDFISKYAAIDVYDGRTKIMDRRSQMAYDHIKGSPPSTAVKMNCKYFCFILLYCHVLGKTH